MIDANRLEQLEKFQTILADYHVSDDAKSVLQHTELVLFAAPTCVGRNTLIRKLIKTGKYHFIVSDTTRILRVNNDVLEQNGVEYWFRSEEEFLADLAAGKYLEAAVIHNQQVSGISIREIEQARKEGKIAATDIEVVGAHNVVKAKPDTICLFVLPPSFEEWMRRIKGRGHMPEAEFRNRLESACKEFRAALEHDYYIFLVNDDFEIALKNIDHIVTTKEIDSQKQAENMRLTQELLNRSEELLKELKQE